MMPTALSRERLFQILRELQPCRGNEARSVSKHCDRAVEDRSIAKLADGASARAAAASADRAPRRRAAPGAAIAGDGAVTADLERRIGGLPAPRAGPPGRGVGTDAGRHRTLPLRPAAPAQASIACCNRDRSGTDRVASASNPRAKSRNWPRMPSMRITLRSAPATSSASASLSIASASRSFVRGVRRS